MAVIKIVPMPGAVGDKGDEGAPGAQGPQGPAGQNGLPGTPALWSYQGAWNSAAAYAVGDVVVYQGQLYYTKSVTTAGTLPTVTAKFDLIASKGADGTNGTNGTNGAPGAGFGIFYLGNYNPSSGYVPDIAVVRGSDGQLYLAKASGQLGDPVGNTAQWEVWIPKGQDGAPGTNGADALWNYTGEYNGGASYAVGDVATYDGQLWYRYNSNGGNVGDTPSPGLWNLLAAKGADALNTSVPYTGIHDNTNTAVGVNALQNNTLGLNNTAIGHGAMADTTTATSNVAIGQDSLSKNIEHGFNTAVGAGSLFSSVTGYLNTAIGISALGYKTTGYSNTAVGSEALRYNTTGSFNTAIGVDAGINNVTGDGNVFVGFGAGSNELGSNKLYIDNSNTSTPLIHGDFATNTLTVNGSLNVSTGATGTFQTSDSKIVSVVNGIIVGIESLT